MTHDRDDSFLGRWSRRKRGVEGQTDSPAPEPPRDIVTPQAAEAHQRELAANRAAAEAVDLESIDRDTDLSVFFKQGVPAPLKQAALRKMWRSDPVFAVLDGLNDYDWDCNDPSRVLTSFKSAWQVGRGYVTDTDEAPEAVAEPVAGADVEEEAAPQPADAHPPTTAEAEAPPPAPEAAQPAEPEEEAPEEPVRPTVSLRARRARFGDG